MNINFFTTEWAENPDFFINTNDHYYFNYGMD